jgi:hypothetical protein
MMTVFILPQAHISLIRALLDEKQHDLGFLKQNLAAKALYTLFGLRVCLQLDMKAKIQ